MSRKRTARNLWGMAAITILALGLILIRPALAAQDPWPKRFEHPKGTVVMYQPQLEEFKDDKLTGRAAVSVKTKEMKTPVFGAIWLSAKVTIDRDTRMATIDDVQVTEAKFPSAVDAKPEQIEKLKTFLNTEMEDWSFPIALDRLLAALEVLEKAHAGDQGLKNDPPRIIFVTHPAVLVVLDGDPKLLPVPKSALMRVANTPFLMFYDPAAKTYYLKGGETWLSAQDLKGPWKDLEAVPEPLKALETQAQKAAPAQGQGAAPKAEAGKDQKPEILVSTVPTELLVTQGEPQYTPISGTNLLYVSNTENQIFMDTATQDYYALLSGRWFKTKSLVSGPWAYVAPTQLPADFAKIPENSVKGFVLVHVTGTAQAKEAVLDNAIPQTGVIDRKKATTKVAYAGEPKFEKIADTNLEYAVNSGTSVFKEGTKYYAVDQGVWYEANSPNGPWKVSVSPPKQVDQIPPSNPNYTAKYVKVYDSTPDTVTVGYTSGYTGSYVDNGTVVYGTGYDYQGYSSPDAYVPAPATYGYSAAYDPYAGSWGCQPSSYDPASWLVPSLVGLAAGVAIGAAVSHWWGPGPYYGGWWGAGGYNNININNIHNNVINWHPDRHPDWRHDHGRPIVHPVVKPENRQNLYNRPGNENRLASKTTPRPATPGQAGQIKPGQVKPAQVKPSQVKPAQVKPAQPRVQPAGGPNNVLADRHGNVYKPDAHGNWQQRQGNQWAKAGGERPGTGPAAGARPTPRPEPPKAAPRPTPSERPAVSQHPSFDSRQLDRDMAARQRGEMRTQNFQHASQAARPSPSYSRPGGGGAGVHGGRAGGGRRR